MQVSKLIVALTVAAGFASASFAQAPATPAVPAVPATRVTAPAPAAVEKKVEAPKAAEPVKAEAAKPATLAVKAEPAKMEAPKADHGKPAEKHGKSKGHEKKEHKTEAVTPAAPVTK